MHLTVDPFVRDSGGLASFRFAYMNFQAFSGYGMLSCGLTWQHACISGRWLTAILKATCQYKTLTGNRLSPNTASHSL